MDQDREIPNNPVILIVDDTLANLSVLRSVLEYESYKVSITISGQATLKIAMSIQPALILLHIIMPEIDGFETCHRLKEDAVSAEVRVVFITARNDTESVIEDFRVGGVDYITKPSKKQEVRDRVESHLKINQLTKELLS